MIREENGEWKLYTRDGSRVLGTHPSRGQALRQERAILYRQHMSKKAEGAPVPNRLLLEAIEAALDMGARKFKQKSKAGLPTTEKDLEIWKREKIRERLSAMKALEEGLGKKADVGSIAVPEGLLYEAASGDPHSAGELKRLEEAHTRQVFGAGRRGPARSLLSRSLLGRTRSAGALTENERRLLESRPELNQLSASSQPDESYPVSRALTSPGLVAVPSAGAGAVLARLIAQVAGASPSEKELATAAGAGLGGVAGSMATYGLRQRHAKRLGRWMHEKDLESKRLKEEALRLQDQEEGQVPQDYRTITASVDAKNLVPNFLSSLSMIKESKGLLRLLGIGAEKGLVQGAEQALERAAIRGAEGGIAKRLASEYAVPDLQRAVEAAIERHPEKALDLSRMFAQRTGVGAPPELPFVPIPGVGQGTGVVAPELIGAVQQSAAASQAAARAGMPLEKFLAMRFNTEGVRVPVGNIPSMNWAQDRFSPFLAGPAPTYPAGFNAPIGSIRAPIFSSVPVGQLAPSGPPVPWMPNIAEAPRPMVSADLGATNPGIPLGFAPTHPPIPAPQPLPRG